MFETKYVQAEDKARHDEFFRHHFGGLGRKRPMVPLYHYTNGANLIRIIESGKLWATQIACLNDAKEMVHAVELLEAAISVREQAEISDEFSTLLTKFRELLANFSPEIVGAFVTSFSERKDDLSQWRAYGGYAIEFDIESLLKFSAERSRFLLPVAYDAGTKNILMSDILEWAEKFFNEGILLKRAPSLEAWVEDFAAYWLDQISYLAPVLKHPTFSDESEWRLIHFLRPDDLQQLQFIDRQSMMTRHLPLELSEANEVGYTPLPITGIIVGSQSDWKVSCISVGDLLIKNGYLIDNVAVTHTEIPYRTAH